MKIKISFFEKEAKELADRLQAIDYNQLPISDYNKQYLNRQKQACLYYTRICGHCLARCYTTLHALDRSFTFVDYGGGSGFMSMMAKKIGIKRVIYIDLNPLSVETVKVLKEKTGLGPDIILQGDSDTLAAWCAEEKIKPELLIGLDVIEHVYNLEKLFADLIGIDKGMEIMFTTASNPLNVHKKRKLQQLMLDYEKGGNASPNYYELRKDFIVRTYPGLYSPDELEKVAISSRGLTFDDMSRIIIGNKMSREQKLALPYNKDPYNTCDPRNGNWMERILPLKAYEDLLKPYHYSLEIGNGFYNADRKNPLTSLIAKIANYFIMRANIYGLLVAPFVILHCLSAKRPK
jgi:2-polyprenyl-3-methyl-5-hydroxy-6-metoxy-1,4-benzoquinol methylase